jgi:uncharacterized protein YjbJ (UPF0337 family)
MTTSHTPRHNNESLGDEIERRWDNFQDSFRQRWDKLTNRDIQDCQASREELVAKLQERYGRSRNDIEREVDDFMREHQIHDHGAVHNTQNSRRDQRDQRDHRDTDRTRETERDRAHATPRSGATGSTGATGHTR